MQTECDEIEQCKTNAKIERVREIERGRGRARETKRQRERGQEKNSEMKTKRQ